MKKKIMLVYGTRPEAIKMAPLVKEFRKYPERFDTIVCLTGQHRQMLDQVNSFFEIEGDLDLDLMRPNQTLASLASRTMSSLDSVFTEHKPDLVFVQGDTATVMATAMTAYFHQIPVAHLEAGLRSGDKYSPFPEEINRIVAGHIAEMHFAPTENASENLNREGLSVNVHVVGNTVIDALLLGRNKVLDNPDIYARKFYFLESGKKTILVTGHRRESFGNAFENICLALKDIVEANKDIQIVYPVHLNPNVQEPVKRLLSDEKNIHLIEPLDYPHLIWLMDASYFVLTDSGGIQEEAPALGKPVLVMRDVTERQEGVDAGTALLVGTDRQKIVEEASRLINDKGAYESMANAVNPYGDGTTSRQIIDILTEMWSS